MKHSNNWIKNTLSIFSTTPAYLAALKSFNNQKNGFSISGLSGFSTPLFLYSLYQRVNKTILVVASDTNEAEYIRDDLEAFNTDNSVCFLPESQKSSFLLTDIESLNLYFTNDVLRRLTSAEEPIIVSSFEALKTKFPTFEYFQNFKRSFSIGDTIKRDELLAILDEYGYVPSVVAESPFDYCIKGGIIDLFPPESLLPYRFEFFGDTLESIRTFNPDSQLSVNSFSSFSIQAPASSSSNDKQTTTIFSFLPKDTIIFLLHADKIADVDYQNNFGISLKKYFTIFHYDLFASDVDFKTNLPPQKTTLDDFKAYLNSILYTQPSSQITLFCANSAQAKRLSELLDLDRVNYLDFSVYSGVELPDAGLYFYTDHQIFKRERSISFFKYFTRDVPIVKFNPYEVNRGDLMVHINYGIGRFSGLDKISAFGSIRECLCLEYLGGDKVYVPLEKLNYVQKYLGDPKNSPQLNKLGTVDWERTKLKTRRAIDEISNELVELYAKRISATGFSYPPDSELQNLIESEFIYEETPDQITAIQAVKEDMEAARPMDRLLCGDVGFGKTEVAIRASFKAVSGSKQVALLVPTTILADQHYAVFKRRFEKYPVNIAFLSRFVSRKTQAQIIHDLAEGKIDIVIGTHRLLSKDIVFNDLGLLIIDEEHRFGVKDKERIKFLRESIDVLALSATPIPRSLHFSLIGARDFSVINTPPLSRLPVVTEVILFDPNVVKNSILREINRGGQVFFVHNDIKSIGSICHKLSLIVPQATIGYVHGQMNERDLEKTMEAFINNNINILVTTTIIESGIDIPNANTIFINHAHHYGLAQLYQLRGRVGRSSRRAYAYLIVPEPSRIKPDSLKKLQAIKKYTALGSGYSLALQDLEIRGAGNLFGTSQSGNIGAIGYELYMKFMRESIEQLKNESTSFRQKIQTDTEVNCPLPAFFPDDFIADPSVRLEYYRQLSIAESLADVDTISNNICDIFGKLPPEAITIFDVSKVRLLASSLGIKKVNITENKINFVWDESYVPASGELLLHALQNSASTMGVSYKLNPHNALNLIIYLNISNAFDKIICFLNLLGNTLNL